MKTITRFVMLIPMVFLWPLTGHGQDTPAAPWSKLESLDQTSRQPDAEAWIQPEHYQAARLDTSVLATVMALAPLESDVVGRAVSALLVLPTPDGGEERFEIFESPIMEPALAKWFAAQGWPMKTYAGDSLDNPATTVRLDWGGPTGFHAMVSGPERTYLIDPAWKGNREIYVSYLKEHSPKDDPGFECAVNESHPIDPTAIRAGTSPGSSLRTYRLAMAATGEYSQYHDSASSADAKTDAQSAIVTTVNRVNQVFERDLSLRLVLVGNNADVVYTDPSTDPYTNGNDSLMLTENQTAIDEQIGSSNYDIGHVVSVGSGGLAALGSTCSSQKAEGMTALDNPKGDGFDIDFLAHEIGHQLGGNHTYNAYHDTDYGSCNTRADTAAYEPGSGSTIMGYAGICASQNLQQNADDYFHGHSLDEMLNHLGGEGNCYTTAASGNNNAPTVEAGSNYTIPANTPFELTAVSGADGDGDSLTYTWEQFDLGDAQAVTDADNGSSPILRSWKPSTSPIRVIPRTQDLVANTLSVGEKLPATSRTMNFRVTARDNHAGGGRIGEDTMSVTTTTGAGPFRLTAPNTSQSFEGGATTTVTWDVASTNLSPVNATSVDILFSTDGGYTYPYTLASATLNDGSEAVTLPTSVSTAQGRIKVKGSGNIFFDISDADLVVNAVEQCSTPGSTIPDNGSVSDQISVSTSGNVADLNLYLDATIDWIGDFQATLEHVDSSTSAMVVDRPAYPTGTYGCGTGTISATLDDEATSPIETACSENQTSTLTGSYTPNNPLSAFDSKNLTGTWKLTVADVAGGGATAPYTGTLNKWCIKATKTVSQSGADTCSANAVTLPSPGYSSGTYNISSQTSITSDVTGTVNVASGVTLTLKAPTINLKPGFTAATGSAVTATAQSVTCP